MLLFDILLLIGIIGYFLLGMSYAMNNLDKIKIETIGDVVLFVLFLPFGLFVILCDILIRYIMMPILDLEIWKKKL